MTYDYTYGLCLCGHELAYCSTCASESCPLCDGREDVRDGRLVVVDSLGHIIDELGSAAERCAALAASAEMEAMA